MSRPSKLTTTQCARIRAMKTDPVHPVPAPALAKRFHVSESSIYKVLDGSYVPRVAHTPAKKCGTQAPAMTRTSAITDIPAVPAERPTGAMPSIFSRGRSDADQTLGQILEQAAKTDPQAPVDALTLAAAEFVLARDRFNKALAQHPA